MKTSVSDGAAPPGAVAPCARCGGRGYFPDDYEVVCCGVRGQDGECCGSPDRDYRVCPDCLKAGRVLAVMRF